MADATQTTTNVRPAHVLEGLPFGSFSHPDDRARLQLLKKLPGIERLTNRLGKHSYERMVRMSLLANAVRAGGGAYSSVADLYKAACQALDVCMPELYLQSNMTRPAITLGADQPLTILNTAMLERLSEDELYCLFAHEASHLHCNHLWYLLVCDFARDCQEFLGVFGAPIAGMRLPLEQWRRRAELSCDRGAYLVCRDLPVQLSLLGKLAGREAVPAGVLLAQGKEFETLASEQALGKLYRMKMYLDDTASFAALRAVEISRWTETDECATLLRGEADFNDPETGAGESLWGEFAHSSAAPPPVEPMSGHAEEIALGLKSAAAGALGIASQGAAMMQAAIGSLLDSVLDEDEDATVAVGGATPNPDSEIISIKVEKQ